MRLPRSLGMVSLKDFGRLLLDSAYEWSRHRAASKGAALALYMMFSLAPMLILVIAVAGTFFSEEAVQSELFGQIRAWTGERNAEVIRTVLASARESGKDSVAALLSIVILLFSATTAFAELKASLDELWEVEDRNSIKKLIHSRILSFGLVLMLALFLLFSLTVNAVIAATRAHYGVVWANPMVAIAAQWLSQLFSFGIVTALFGVVYKLLPDTHIAWRHVWPGAVLTAALFLLGKWAIGLCLNWSGTASTYGAAGSLIALLLWIYYSAQIFFLGAVFTRQYEKWITRSD